MSTILKRAAAVMLAALLAASILPFGASAAGSSGPGLSDLARVPAGERLPRFIDDVGMVTEAQAAELTAKLDEISERHQFDTVIAVVERIDHREPRLYGIDFFEQNGFGFGDELDGVILLQVTGSREFGFASYGYGHTAFTVAGQDYIDRLFLPYLRADNYFAAYMAFADAVDDFLTKAKAGAPYDTGNIPSLTPLERNGYRRTAAIASVVVALIVALCVTITWRFQLKSVRKSNLAHEYIRDGSMNLTTRRDMFLYRRVSKTRRETNSGGGSGGGGGGSFSSSSGRSATGHSGKY